MSAPKGNLHIFRIARGRRGGRRKTLDAEKRSVAVNLYNEKKMTIKKICKMMGISKPTLYAYVQESQEAVN